VNTNERFKCLNTDSIHPVMVDIKNMYTEMKHKSILVAVNWLLNISSGLDRHRDRLAVRRFKYKDNRYITHWGRSYNSITHCEITRQTLYDIIEFDMNNVIFTVGNVILRQIDGIPMGGFISAPEAQLVCIYAEIQLHLSLGMDTKYISGKRYMDDLTVFITYDSDCSYSTARKDRIIQKILYHTYDEKLVLESQDTQKDGSYTFLECLVRINGKFVYIEPFHKNWENILLFGKQKLYKFQSFYSYSNRKSKVDMVTGTIIRLLTYCMDDESIKISIMKLWRELQTLDYPVHTIKSSLRHIFNKTKERKWLTYQSIL